jgi:hypothetical protein
LLSGENRLGIGAAARAENDDTHDKFELVRGNILHAHLTHCVIRSV